MKNLQINNKKIENSKLTKTQTKQNKKQKKI